ncbi:FAD-binding-3 domain-containing protein [Mycena chlorophos]|uniref:FAD-binding-3 domain-containing protein n=1 Tax=Mycena chlorophos TaxID=658473 RepID=A0A8H6WIR7_MYCCL|nr:FAD-binding-3 domain-containing protein [Mycena chlorophos]
MAASVLIAGAGPSGLILALILAKSGVSVRLIDKELTHRVGSKGSGIQARTLELYAQLGIYDSLRAIGEHIPDIAVYEPGKTVPAKYVRLSPIVEATPGTPYPNSLNIPQDHHEAVLRTHLSALGVEVELGTELRAFDHTASRDYVLATLVKHQADGSEVVEEGKYEWLVGTDGAHSIVRKALGLSFLGETQEDAEMAVGDIEVHGVDPKRRQFWHMWSAPPRTIVLRSSHPASNVFMLAYIGIQGDISPTGLTRDEFLKAFYEVTKLKREDVAFGEATWMSRYRPNIRMVDRMRVGRVFVAGDAAHCHSPAGGQGLNSSVADVANLAWKLALVQKRLAPESLLDTYGEERLRVIAQMLRLTTELYGHTMNSFGTKQQIASEAPADPELATAGGDGPAQMSVARSGRELTMLGVNYHGSSIISSEATAATTEAYAKPETLSAKPAYRAPDAPGLLDGAGNANNLFGVFDGVRHTVLVFAPARSESDVSDIVAFLGRLPGAAETIRSVRVLPAGLGTGTSTGFDLVLEDAQGHAYKEYNVDVNADKPTVVVVRPDGVVGAVEGSVQGLERYFGRIFVGF